VYLGSVARVDMTFAHAEVLDIRPRARTLQHLLRWEDEDAVVERWIENCLSTKAKDVREPSRLVMGDYLKGHWSRELERQEALKASKPPAISNRWQPPGSGLLEENKFRCNKGPIGFALDVISQWHKEFIRTVLCFLQTMNATANFPSREGMRSW
jgi:hypothetical protein